MEGFSGYCKYGWKMAIFCLTKDAEDNVTVMKKEFCGLDGAGKASPPLHGVVH
jgi:hypothetical protein